MKYTLYTNTRGPGARKGFVLPFTMFIAVIVLFITVGAMTLLSKQLYFSKLYKQSQAAYYAADDAVTCATTIDDTYISSDGLGIFSGSSTYSTYHNGHDYSQDVLDTYNTQHGTSISFTGVNAIKCAQSVIFDPSSATSNFHIVGNYTYYPPDVSVGSEIGVTSSYNMQMDLGDGTFRCAKVTVNKTQSFRQIIAQGYAECGNPNGTVERAVVNTVVVE
jgi:hypothetical protein